MCAIASKSSYYKATTGDILRAKEYFGKACFIRELNAQLEASQNSSAAKGSISVLGLQAM
jgi:hypothetical protein